MSHADPHREPPHEDPHSERPQRNLQEADLVRAREVLERTVRFLAQCAEDPQAALQAEDPRDLIRALESIATAPAAEPAAEPVKEPRTIPIRRRRSA